MSLTFLLYHSHAKIPDAPSHHNAILLKCRDNNFARGITGFLHREEDVFVQYLEGPGEALDALLARLRKDPRHEDVTVVTRGSLPMRRLPDWQMGFLGAGQLSLVDLVGLRDGQLDMASADPAELIDFVIENADALSEEAMAA